MQWVGLTDNYEYYYCLSNLLAFILMSTTPPLLVYIEHFCNPLDFTTALLVPGRIHFPTDRDFYDKFLN